MEIKTVADFNAALKEGPYTSIGSYPIFFITADGGALAYKTAKENADYIKDAIKTNDKHSGWRVIGADINWEDPELYDSDTGERIESAYAEDSRSNPPSRAKRRR